METELVEKSRRGRKKKPIQDVQIKKRRGRKLAVDYYSTSACQKEMSKPSSIISNTILQLNVDTKESDYNLEAFNIEEHKRFKISQEFKKMQELKNDTILEDYLNAGSVGSLEEIYKSQVNNRREQDNNFIKILTDYYNGGGDIELEQKDSDTFDDEKEKVKEDAIKSTMIDTLDVVETNIKGIKNVTILKDIVNIDWPDKTNIKCWWCCHNFNTVPIGIPIRYMKKQDKYQVRGMYCSIACMYSGSKQEDTCKDKKSMVKAFYNRLTNGSICDEIKEAPPREVLKDFGGNMTINEFRELSKNRNVYKTIKYPMILREDTVNISDIEKMKNIHKKLTNKTGVKMVDKPLQKTTIETLLDIEYEDE